MGRAYWKRGITGLLVLAAGAAILGSTENAYCAENTNGNRLSYDLKLDLPLMGGSAVLWLTGGLFRKHLAPSTCTWCERNGLDEGVRDGLKWENTKIAQNLSDLSAFALLPAATLGTTAAFATSDGRSDELWVDALIVGEAVALAGLANTVVKYSVARERPYVRGISAEDRLTDPSRWEHHVSFYSGHASLAFSAAAATGTVASMRGYSGAPWIWAGGMTVAAFTGYCRIAADKHYMTDVLAGAIVGAGIGVMTPLLLHKAQRAQESSTMAGMQLQPIRSGWMMSFGGAW